MKKGFQKTIAYLLTAVLLITSIPFVGFAQTDVDSSAQLEQHAFADGLTWSFDEDTGKLTVTGNGAIPDYDMNISVTEQYPDFDIYDYFGVEKKDAEDETTGTSSSTATLAEDEEGDEEATGSFAPWSEYISKIKSVVISEGVTAIGASSFMFALYLEEVTVASTVKTIGDWSFAGCFKLKKFNFPEGLESIGHYAFGYTAIEEVTLPSSLKTLGAYAFLYSTTSKLNILGDFELLADPEADIEEGEEVEPSAFMGCFMINSIALPADATDVTKYLGTSTILCNIKEIRNLSTTSSFLEEYLSYFRTFSDEDFDFYIYKMNLVSMYAEILNDLLGIFPEGEDEVESDNFLFALWGVSSYEEWEERIEEIEKNEAINATLSFENMTIYCAADSSEHKAAKKYGVKHFVGDSETECNCFKFEGSVNDTLTWKLDTESRTLIFEGEGDIPEYENTMQTPWYTLGGKYDTIDFSKAKIGKIGDASFSVSRVKEIIFGSDIENIVGENDTPFMLCNKIEKITLTNNVTKVNMASLSALLEDAGNEKTEVVINNKDCEISGTAGKAITSIRGYRNSTAATYANTNSIEFKPIVNEAPASDFEYKVTDEGFIQITKYKGTDTDISVPDKIDGKRVDFIGDYDGSAFSGTSVEYVVIPEGVTTIGAYCFSYCETLQAIELPDSLKEIEPVAFNGCTSLSEIELPKNLVLVGEASFNGCSSLKEITIPQSVYEISPLAFVGCPELKITILSSMCQLPTIYTTNPDLVDHKDEYKMVDNDATIYGYTDSTAEEYAEVFGVKFVSIGNLPEKSSPSDFTYTVNDDATIKVTGYKGLSRNIYIPEKIDGKTVTAIGEKAFTELVINKLSIADTITTIEKEAFLECYDLKEVVLPKSLVTVGDYAFAALESITELIIPDEVKTIGNWAFADCINIKEINIPSKVETIGDYAFAYCPAFEKITIPASVKSIGKFAFCYSSAEAINVDENNKYYTAYDGILYNKDMTVVIYCPEARKETTYTVPDTVESIGESTFADCENLEKVNISGNVSQIGDSAFEKCTGLTEVNIEAGTTAAQLSFFSLARARAAQDNETAIGAKAFSECTKLEKIVLPETVTSIGANAFDMCSSLNKITITNEECEIYDKNDTFPESTTICAPEGSTAQAYAEKYNRKFEKLEHTHEWDNGKVTTPATHLKEGVKTFTCACGETKTEPVAKLADHEWDNGKVTTPATHLKEGVKTYTCACGETKTEPVSKLADHEWDNGKVTTPATHLKEGVKTFTCACGETKTEPVAKLADHEWDNGKVTTPATHLKEGVKTFTCACGETKTEPVAKLADHEWDNGKVTTPATHLKEGVKTFTCACGETKTEPVAKLAEHEWDNGKVTTPATHLKEGVMTYTCACGETKTEPVAKLADHEWDNGKVTTPATHLKEGVKTFTCACGETKTEPVAKIKEHSYTDNVVAPTCTEKGYTTHTCACGDSYTDTYVDATGHNYVNGVCADCGDIEQNQGDTTEKCDCICHSTSGFSKFIYKLLCFFWKLFKTKQYCDCGVAHY